MPLRTLLQPLENFVYFVDLRRIDMCREVVERPIDYLKTFE